MYKPGGTLRDALTNIENKRWVLPAIQRAFIWKPQQVCALFDSLMQGFPFGTFLLWKIEPERSGDWKFYDFVRDYHERDAPHCPDLGSITERALTAVLDGQQRLTALNVGLRGSMALHRKYKWRGNPNAYPRWNLYLNLLSDETDDGSAMEVELTKERYKFEFMEYPRDYAAGREFWFRISEILTMSSGPQMLTWLNSKSPAREDLEPAFKTLDRLHQVIHKEPVVYYYEEESPNLDRVLKIFIRLNSQGTPLSQSDLLHSIAVAQWSKRDARHEISRAVDDLNYAGRWIGFNQNFVLKAGLMLADVASVGFKVENFTRKNMELLEKDWDQIRTALLMTAQLATNFGLDGRSIRALSSLLPIAYYLFRVKAPESFLTHTKYADDRNEIRHWLLKSLLKPSGIWGSGLDTLLTALREVIRDNGSSGFPTKKLQRAMELRGKSLKFSEIEIQQLIDIEYSDKRAFLVLSLLYPFVDLRNKFHIDHIFPASLLTKTALKKAEVADDKAEWIYLRRNQLGNLQLLDGAENMEKRKTLPARWIENRYPDLAERKHHLSLYDMGHELPTGVDRFAEFFEPRRERMQNRIKSVLSE